MADRILLIEDDLRLISRDRCAVDFASALLVSRHHVQRRRGHHGALAIAAWDLGIDLPKAALARLLVNEPEHRQVNPGLPVGQNRR